MHPDQLRLALSEFADELATMNRNLSAITATLLAMRLALLEIDREKRFEAVFDRHSAGPEVAQVERKYAEKIAALSSLARELR